MKFTTDYLKNEIAKEKIINLNFDYLSKNIEKWWSYCDKQQKFYLLKFDLTKIILYNIKNEDLYYFDKVGYENIAAINIINIFSLDCPKLSLLVHEALSDLFQLQDIKYPYEDHKSLYLKPEGIGYCDWGNGYGEITPHSDDLYETLNADFLSLTVCRDKTNTPTVFYFIKDILQNFNDKELSRLIDMELKFISGKNVKIVKTRQRKLLEYQPNIGFKFCLDFRINNISEERMIPLNEHDKDLIIKMKDNIKSCKYSQSISKTGTFLIIANDKVLHARAQMQLDYKIATEIAKSEDFSNIPRLLFRSKDPRKIYLHV